MVFIRFLIFIKTLKNRFSQMIINKKRFKKIFANGYKLKRMRVNRGSIGGLIGVHVSIVKWSFQDNFKPVYFFYEKISRVQKVPKRKASDFHPHKTCAREKLLPFLFRACLILFCWLMFACECFCAGETFRKNNYKQAWNCLDNLISLYYR